MATTDCAAIKTELDQANAAYKRLTEGGATKVVHDSDGSHIEYTAANSSKLYQRIALLQAQYDACIAGSSRAVVTRPLQFFF